VYRARGRRARGLCAARGAYDRLTCRRWQQMWPADGGLAPGLEQAPRALELPCIASRPKTARARADCAAVASARGANRNC